MITRKELRTDVLESKDVPGEWRTEAIDMDHEGECLVTIFSGPEARERADEYAAWKNRS